MENTILQLSTSKGRLTEGQFVTYKGDEDCKIYRIDNLESVSFFYPSEDGSLINVKINDDNLKF